MVLTTAPDSGRPKDTDQKSLLGSASERVAVTRTGRSIMTARSSQLHFACRHVRRCHIHEGPLPANVTLRAQLRGGSKKSRGYHSRVDIIVSNRHWMRGEGWLT
jgi:hypothetical protein